MLNGRKRLTSKTQRPKRLESKMFNVKNTSREKCLMAKTLNVKTLRMKNPKCQKHNVENA